MFDIDEYRAEWNLIILWSGPAGGPMTFRLALPRAAGGAWGAPDAHWIEEIPFGVGQLTTGADDYLDADLGELDFHQLSDHDKIAAEEG